MEQFEDADVRVSMVCLFDFENRQEVFFAVFLEPKIRYLHVLYECGKKCGQICLKLHTIQQLDKSVKSHTNHFSYLQILL